MSDVPAKWTIQVKKLGGDKVVIEDAVSYGIENGILSILMAVEPPEYIVYPLAVIERLKIKGA